MKQCHKCKSEWVSEKRQPAYKEYCEGCSAYLHCCMNCRYHDPSAHNECYIPNTDWVGDRSGANFCHEFEFADTEVEDGAGGKQEQARKALDALTGPETSPKPKSIEDLFPD